MNTLKVIFDFLLSVAQLVFRGKRKCQRNQPEPDDSSSAGSPAPQHGSGSGGYRSDTLALPKRAPSPENLMGWALIIFALSSYLMKLAG